MPPNIKFHRDPSGLTHIKVEAHVGTSSKALRDTLTVALEAFLSGKSIVVTSHQMARELHHGFPVSHSPLRSNNDRGRETRMGTQKD